MKTIDVKPQPLLSFGRTAQLALVGVRYRLFRASVTVVVIAVAMAFLANILSESLIKSAVATQARTGIREMRLVESWIAKLSVPAGEVEIIRAIGAAPPDPSAYQELVGFAGDGAGDPDRMAESARLAVPCLDFFTELDYGRRRVMVRNAEGTAIFDALSGPGRMDVFSERLASMKSIRFPITVETFSSFLQDWPALKAWVGRVRAGQGEAIRSVRENLGDLTILEGLAQADQGLDAAIRDAGFHLDEDEATALGERARRARSAYHIESALGLLDVRKRIAARRDILPSDVNPELLWDLVRDEADAAWLLDVMEEQGLQRSDLDTPGLTALADSKARERLLTVAELATSDAGGGFMGMGTRMSWLAFVSMLVCVVGIANAMLMSVTERFREIATLKCLGALDGFIMTVFLIEAAVLGLAGGVAGAVGGTFLGIVRMLVRFRGLMLEAFPVSDLVTAMLVSVVLGVLLAAISAVYPSLRAAQLAPMEAMRIE